ncbi:probable acyl-activating enzyme 2 isoform X1 [Olea europaea subsp. europaea]|uniref:Probable acyl-activating enzyme 2 isoform X1 n=1 Tax=Olea europaea subsp. europaea TaxID=158383 RepID=A0A8S0S1V0_OLEEU|nr:probable acyl-activating enzyme 2 isoform X1 [Olea europaea subsp. europaea]
MSQFSKRSSSLSSLSRWFFRGQNRAQNCRHLCRLTESVEESWEPMKGLVKCSANHVPLSPISFLERAAKVYRDRKSVVYGSVKYNWGETYIRCVKLASALTQLGIARGDIVYHPKLIVTQINETITEAFEHLIKIHLRIFY